MTPALPSPLRRTLARIAGALAGSEDWWIIGSAAVALHGAPAGPVGDVDVLTSDQGARRLTDRLGVSIGMGAPHERFRSARFARCPTADLAIEVMAGFDARGSDGEWRRIWPVSRQPIALDGSTLFVPARAELAALLMSFGRAKDLARAAALSG